MKFGRNNIIYRLIFCAFLLISADISVLVATGECRDVKVGVFHNYPIIYEENGEVTGFHAELLKAVAKEEGWNLLFQPGGTLKDVLNGLKHRTVDVGMSLMPTPERREFADYSDEPNVILWGQVFIKSGETAIHNLLDLNGKTIAFIGRGTSGKNFMTLCEKFGVKVQFETITTYEEVARAVHDGKVDGGVFNNFQGYKYSKLYNIKPSSILFKPTPVLYAVPEGVNWDIIEAIDRNLRGWKADSESIYYQLEEEFLSALNRKGKGWERDQLFIAVLLCLLFVLIGISLGFYLGGKVGERNLGKRYIKHIILFTVSMGLAFTLIDSLIDSVLFHHDQSFLETNILHVTPEHLYTRGMFFLLCAIFAFFFARYMGMYLDVQARLTKSEDRYRDLVERSSDWIWEIDENMNYTYSSPKIEQLLGYKPEEVIGKPPFSIMPLEEQDKVAAKFAPFREARSSFSNLVNINQHKEGRLVHLETSGVPIFAENGDFRGYRGIDRDITERKVLEEKLQQSQRLEAIGTLAGGIAHDFNNILTPILGYTELASSQLSESKDIKSHLKEISKAGFRAKELVRQILTFSRQTDKNRSPLRVSPLVKEAIKLLRATIPTTIEIKQALDEQCGPVLGSPTQIHQIIMNLCTNAYHAMREGGGVLGVTVREVVLAEHDIHQKMDLDPGKYMCLEVSDTGHGILPEDKEMIFEPYFTTKDVGDGTGMGLAVVQGIVKSYDGYVSVYSEPDKGTTFVIYLPIVDEDEEQEVCDEQKIIKGNGERVLLVDDQKEVVQLQKFLLENLGYQVTALSNSLLSLEQFKNNPSEYDLVITDMTMPGLNGAELSRKLKEIRPDIPIIICTGFSELMSEEKANELGIEGYLMKPVNNRDISRVINQALGNKQEVAR